MRMRKAILLALLVGIVNSTTGVVRADNVYAKTLLESAQRALQDNNYKTAEEQFKKVLAYDEQQSGAESAEVARDLSNLALVYLNQGRYQDAEPLYKKAVQMLDGKMGSEHADTATSLNNLAWLYTNENRFGEAEELLAKALAIREKEFGKESPAVARNLANLAKVYTARADYASAQALLEQAIKIEIATLGADHLDVQANVRDLADVLVAQKKWVLAESLYRKIMQMDSKLAHDAEGEAILAADMDAFVGCLRALNKQEEASELDHKAIEIKKKLPGAILSSPVKSEAIKPDKSGIATANCPVKDKWAVVVGISNFEDPAMNLKYAAKDATDFRNYLIKDAHFQPDHVKLLIDKEATRQNIVSTIGDGWLKRVANPDDLVVLYISTHGSSAKQEAGSANFIVPYDGNLENIVFTGIPMQWLTAGIKGMVHCDRVVMLLDVCHGGAVAEGGKGLVRTDKTVDFDAAKITTGDGQIVVASSQADQISWESKQYPNGVFTRRLLEGLHANGEKTRLGVAFSYMKDKVQEEVLRDRAHLQTPVLVTKWWHGDDIAIGVTPTSPRPGLAAAVKKQ